MFSRRSINMNKKVLLLLVIPFLVGCDTANTQPSSKHEHTFSKLVVTSDADWRTYIVGSDFDPTGLVVKAECSECHEQVVVEYTLANNTDLELEQDSVSIKYQDLTLSYEIFVKEKYHIACVGDSLTAGHYWANESYPTKLASKVDNKYEVKNCGVNGISITGYGGSWDDPEKRYIKQDVYQQSVDFNPDIFAIMLGTNDATGWSNAEATFDEYYHILLDSYIELFPNARFIMMVSPPCVSPNQFSIPNQTINDEINPRQRELAEEYDFELLDLREEFEATDDFETKYLRPNDGVHFTADGADYVASRVWDIAKNLTF